jgi:Lar family restriction alleviation protein
MTSVILPCPFCGSADIATEGPCYTQFMCEGCGAATYDQEGHAEAIAAWNRRSPEVRSADDITVRLDNLAQSLAGEYPPHTLMDLAEAASLITTLRLQINGGTKE